MLGFKENFSGGVFTTVTGRQYPFVATRDGSDKRRAQKEAEAYTAELVAGAQAKLDQSGATGIRLTPLDLVGERWLKYLPDNRSYREKIVDDGVHRPSQPRDPNADPYATPMAELEAKLQSGYCPNRSEVQARLNALRAGQATWQNKKAAETARAERMVKAGNCLADANANILLLTTADGYTAEDVVAVRKLKDQLRAGLDSDTPVEDVITTYKTNRAAVETTAKARRNAAADAMTQQAKALRADANAVRAGEAPLPTE